MAGAHRCTASAAMNPRSLFSGPDIGQGPMIMVRPARGRSSVRGTHGAFPLCLQPRSARMPQ